jgi:hypothetical protein
MDLDAFKLDHWWHVVAMAGGLIAVAAVPGQFAAAFLIGLGLLFFGAGEWVNHPRQTQVKGAKVVGIYKVTGNPRKMGETYATVKCIKTSRRRLSESLDEIVLGSMLTSAARPIMVFVQLLQVYFLLLK